MKTKAEKSVVANMKKDNSVTKQEKHQTSTCMLR